MQLHVIGALLSLLTVTLCSFPFGAEAASSCPSWTATVNGSDPTIVMDLYPEEQAALAWNAATSNSLVLISKAIGPGDNLDTKAYLQLRQLCGDGDVAWAMQCRLTSFGISLTMTDPWTATTIIQCSYNATADVTQAILPEGTIGWERFDFDASSFTQLSAINALRSAAYCCGQKVDILRIADGSTVKSWSLVDMHPLCVEYGGAKWVAPVGRDVVQGNSRWFVSCIPLWFVMDEDGNVVNTLDDTAMFPQLQPAILDYANDSMLYRWVMYSGVCLMAPSDTNSTCQRCFSYPDLVEYTANSLGAGLLVAPNLPAPSQPPTAGAFPQLVYIPNAHFNQSLDSLSETLNPRAEAIVPSWCPQGALWCVDYSSFFLSLFPASSGINRFRFTIPNADYLSSTWNDTAWLLLASDFFSPPATPESVQLLLAINPVDGTPLRSFRLNTTGLELDARSYNGLCGFLEYDAAQISCCGGVCQPVVLCRLGRPAVEVVQWCGCRVGACAH